ncbi:Uncharacterized protein OBRU01_04875 [Operophtera brumata]|uniref:Uncharacterized protein n=1 Tax=Operophtera brumata TaxID=104452 RepID=A0A0L7LNB9_OPEBR|nr:Uncharacterized protein OBRU01_04875 [Operophtera brumata]
MSDWKAAAIPFDLLLKPKDILRTDPKSVQKRYEKPIDAGRDEAQKTRPRLILTPAVSMDDVMDERARNILCEDMYTSSTMRAMREAVSPYFSVKAPLPGRFTNANPVQSV